MSRGSVIVMAVALGVAPAARAERLAGISAIDGRETRGYVAFTFDDGPDHVTTPPILDLLDEHGIKATFFVVGRRISGKSDNAAANRAVLQRIIDGGHLLGNHTFDHVNLEEAGVEAGIADVDKNNRALKKHAAQEPRLFRPPFGKLPDEVRKKLRSRGYAIITWSIDSKDFSLKTVDKIRKRVVDKLLEDEGGVVLLHDTKARTAEAFRLILEDLQAANCARLAAGKEPIVPAELDHFALDRKGKPLPVPDDVAARTRATRERIEAGCTAVDKNSRND